MYVPPHLRNKSAKSEHNSTVSFVKNSLNVDGHVGVHIVTEDSLSSLGNSNSYSYCFWMTLHTREVGWCSIIHRGYAEFDRCPGLWLCADTNKLHLRVSSSRQANFGKSESNYEVEIGVPVHIAIVVDGTENMIRLFINGELDFKKLLPGKNDTFLPGHGPLYLGRDPWHKSSSFEMSHFVLSSRAMGAGELREHFDSQREGVHAHATEVTLGGREDEESAPGGLTAALLAAHDNDQKDCVGHDGKSKSNSASGDDDGACENNSGGHIAADDDLFFDSLSVFQSDVGAPSTATSQYTVRPSRHLQERQQQRDINLRDLQLARKHGISYATSSGRLVFTYDDVVYVTDGSGTVGITAWRLKTGEDGVIDMHVPNLFEVAVTAT